MKVRLIDKVFYAVLFAVSLLLTVSCSHPTRPDNKSAKAYSFSATQKLFPGQKIRGSVKRIIDGDTFVFLSQNGEELRIRLYGIDTPERKGNQPFNRQATGYLTQLIFGKEITLLISKPAYDKYKRVLAVIQTDDCDDVNYEMIRAGYAWPYKDGQVAKYDRAAATAKKEGKGLWSLANPISPMDWKKGRR